jgi:hypothetical protein
MTEELNVLDNTATRCRQLLSKGLYTNAGMPAGEKATGDGHFWCGKTQTIFGPDDRICDAENCTDATRSCYETN